MISRFHKNFLEPPVSYFSKYNPIADSLPFYIFQAEEFCCGKGHFAEGHGQENYVLHYTISGNAKLIYRGKEYRLSKKTLILIDNMEHLYYENTNNEPWRFRRIIFNGQSARLFCRLINNDNISFIDYNENKFYDYFADSAKNLEKNTEASVITNSLNIHQILAECVDLVNNQKRNVTHNINSVLEFISSNYNKQITTEQLAAISNLSRFHFIKIFKKEIGLPPYEYICKYRITQAKHLLLNTDMSVSEIAEEVGINDSSSFIRQFKARVGCTPYKFRQ